ncbi:hypothetical protein MAHJHV59_03620 [Mycobacterium avium subsp. hominissuis]
MTRSSDRGSSSSAPVSTGAISSLTAATARCTLRPRYRVGSPSRRTNASCAPTEVPVGAAPRPTWPVSVVISTSTSGRALQSSSWRATTEAIRTIDLPDPVEAYRERQPKTNPLRAR